MRKYLFFLFILFLCGCDRYNDPQPGGELSLLRLDIGQASALLIMNDTVTGFNKLYKLSANEVLSEVRVFLSDSTTDTLSLSPQFVYNANSDFIMVLFGSSPQEVRQAYLVRKSDGKLFSLSHIGFPVKAEGHFLSDPVIHADALGNIYFKGHSSSCYCDVSINELFKIKVNAAGLISYSSHLPVNESVTAFEVDPRGNVFYKAKPRNNPNDLVPLFRIKKVGGGFFTLPASTFWLGSNGGFFFNEPELPVKKVTIDNSANISVTDYSDGNLQLSDPTVSYRFNFFHQTVFADKVGNILEMTNASEIPRRVSDVILSSVSAAGKSDDFYYLAGSNPGSDFRLLRVNPNNDNFSNMAAPGKYDIRQLIITKENKAIFTAVRTTDMKTVLVSINHAGTEKVISENLNQPVAALVCIDR